MTPQATPPATSIPIVGVPSTAPIAPPARDEGFPWIEVVSIILLSTLLWTGLRKLELSSYWKGFLALLDLGLLALAVFSLGWTNALLMVVGANLVLVLGNWVRSALRYDDVLTHSSAASGTPKSEMRDLADRLGKAHRRLFNYMRPMRKAQLICHLSERNRNVHEIEAMAPPIAMLWVIDRPEMAKLVDYFDRLMRLWREPASEAMRIADLITATYKNSAMTIQEVIDSLIAFAEGEATSPLSNKRGSAQSNRGA